MVSLKDSATPVAKTGAIATAKQTETNASINKTTNNKLLNLPPRKSVKSKKSNLNDYCFDNNTLHILNIAKKVTYLEEENKATQRAVAKLRQLVSISVQFHKDNVTRERERRF